MTMTPLRWRGTALAVALSSVALLLTAFVGGSDAATKPPVKTRSVKADNGTIKVPANPHRVAVLGNAVLPYLNLGGKPIAVTDVSSSALADLPSAQRTAYKAATNVGASGGETDVEKLARLEPDVIIIAVPDSDFAKLKKKLAAIAPTILLGFESDWKFRANALAQATNKIAANTKQKASYNRLVSQIRQKYGQVLESGKIVEVGTTDATDPGTFSMNDSLCAEVVRDAGIVDFAPAVDSMSFEQIGSLAEYDLILYSAGIDRKPSEAVAPLLATDAWKALPAVQAGHAQPIYCPWGRSFGYMAQYLQGLERALATLPKAG